MPGPGQRARINDPTGRTQSPTARAEAPETNLAVFRPGLASIPIRAGGVLLWSLILWAGWYYGRGYAAAALEPFGVAWLPDVIPWLIGAWVLYRVGYEVLLRQSRLYTLTDRRVKARSGVLRRTTAEAPLRTIQQLVIDRKLAERLTGLGTVLITTAGSQTVDVAWVMIPRSEQIVATIRKAMDDARPMPVWLMDDPNRPARPVVIGLVGGIGAGKSLVASILGNLGCLVIDSDRDAKAMLDRPDVKDRLVRWWGRRVLGSDGRIDRKAVASIVFGDPVQRARLEELVHPLVKSKRADLIERASAEAKVGVVIDAPLLFEAGSDRECDAVLFVDAPPEVRLSRVKSRGWDASELARRENAQMPLEEKRRRADSVIVNDSDPAVLEARVRAVLEDFRKKVAGRA